MIDEKARNPRLDPRPGDVLRVGDETRTVEGLYNYGLEWHSATHHSICSRTTWRRWARTAEVLVEGVEW